jgi:hypothetical protein
MKLRSYSSPELVDLGSVAGVTAVFGGVAKQDLFVVFTGDPNDPDVEIIAEDELSFSGCIVAEPGQPSVGDGCAVFGDE